MNIHHLCDGNLLSYTGGEDFLKLQTENTGNVLFAKIKVFISQCSARIGL